MNIESDDSPPTLEQLKAIVTRPLPSSTYEFIGLSAKISELIKKGQLADKSQEPRVESAVERMKKILANSQLGLNKNKQEQPVAANIKQ